MHGRNAFHCCRRFDVYTDKLLYVTPRFDFCIWKVDNESAHLAYSVVVVVVSNYIKVRPKASGAGLICRTDQYFQRQRLHCLNLLLFDRGHFH